MIFIRRFKNGALVDVTTWGRCDAFGDFIPRTIEQSIQINVMGEAKDKDKIHKNLLANGGNAYYLFCADENCQAHIDDLLIEHRVVGMKQLLTSRELDVIKTLFTLRSTKKTAIHLGSTDRTLVNHQSNMTHKTGFRPSEIAPMMADCASVELLLSVVSPTDQPPPANVALKVLPPSPITA